MTEEREQEETMSSSNIFEMDYWTNSKDIFTYLDIVSPTTGSKFKCSVCGSSHWGTSTMPVTGKDYSIGLAPVELNPIGQDHQPLLIQGKKPPLYYYVLLCITCAHTIFFNGAMVQARLNEYRKLRPDT